MAPQPTTWSTSTSDTNWQPTNSGTANYYADPAQVIFGNTGNGSIGSGTR
jgi:hypothetical protein